MDRLPVTDEELLAAIAEAQRALDQARSVCEAVGESGEALELLDHCIDVRSALLYERALRIGKQYWTMHRRGLE